MTTVAPHVNRVRLDHPLGNRVAVMGHGGKTTLARAIAQRHSLEHIELDQIANLPGWTRRPTDEFRAIVAERMEMNPNGWVTDHYHAEVVDMIHARATSLVVLHLPFRTMMWRRTVRSLRRAWTGEKVCGGNVETFRQHLLSRNSAILEMWQKRDRYRRLSESVSRSAREGIDFYLLRSAAELDRFYDLQGLTRPG